MTHFNPNPIILIVPGWGGSQLYANLLPDHPEYNDFFETNWFNIWINPWKNVIRQHFFVENFKLIYNEDEKRMTNQKHIDIRTLDIGSTDSCEHLCPRFPHFSGYFNHFVQHVVDIFGYQRLKDIFAAPYDFRKIGDIRELDEFFNNLQKFIVNLYQKRKSKILFFTHSLGSVLVVHFLSRMTSDWKNQYIDSWYSVAGAFGGAVQTVMCFLKGIPFFIPRFIPLKQIKLMYTSFPSCLFLLPSPKIFSKDRPFINTESKVYKTQDLIEVIKEVSNDKIQNIIPYVPDLFIDDSPGVDTVCVYSHGFKTLSQINIEGDIHDPKIEEVYEDGDLTILTESLSACKRWKDNQGKYFEILTFEGVDHSKLLSYPKLFEHFDSFLSMRINHLLESG